MTVVFKTDCPKCGGKKKLRTRVDLVLKTYSKAKCYKCGFTQPAGRL